MNPVSLLRSKRPWAGAWYLVSYLFTGTISFVIVFYGTLIAVVLSFTVIGLVLLAFAPVVIRACADLERARLRIVCAEPVRGRYREPDGQSWLARLKTWWSDPAFWREYVYLLALFVPLAVLDFAVLLVWLVLLAGITLPAWYRASWQAFGVHTLPGALLTAVACLVGFGLFSYVVDATARLHAGLARALLGAPDDPLRDAKEVLRHPGPLGAFMSRSGSR